MSLIVLTRLPSRPYQVYQDGATTEIRLMPFVGAKLSDVPNDFTTSELYDEPKQRVTEFGCGLFNDDHVYLWGNADSQDLFTSWRAMHILSHLHTFESSTLQKVYSISKRVLANHSFSTLRELSADLPNISEIRREILQSHLPASELDHMLSICNSPDSPIDLGIIPFHTELSEGTIERTEEVDRTLSLHAEAIHERELLVRSCQHPLLEEESLRAFFRQVGIHHPCTPPATDSWSFYDKDRLDEVILTNSLLHKIPTELYCTEKPHNFRFCGHPIISLIDNSRLILLRARYFEHGGMLLATIDIGRKPATVTHESLTPHEIARRTKVHKLGHLIPASPHFAGIATYETTSRRDLVINYRHTLYWRERLNALLGI